MVGFRGVNIPHPREMRERFQPEGASGALLFGWLISAFLAIIIPVSKWAAERSNYYSYAGKYNQYEQQQRQYEEGYNYNYNGGGNGGNGGGNYYQSFCRWWDFSCRWRMGKYQRMYGNGGDGGGGGEGAQMRAMLPTWFFFFGGSVEEDERRREEMGYGSNDGSMKFVYSCMLIMFAGLAIYGFRSMYRGFDRSGLVACLLIFGIFCLLNLLTAVGGTIETDGRFFEDSVYGWFGQWSVLVAYTDFWMMLHCFIFAAFLGVGQCLERRAQRAVAVEQQQTLEMGYRAEDHDPVEASRQKEYHDRLREAQALGANV